MLVQGRNRRCITVDMRTEKGREIIKQLAGNVDVLVENFRPGVMEKWGLGPQVCFQGFKQTLQPFSSHTILPITSLPTTLLTGNTST